MIDFLTVSQLNFYIKSMFDGDENLTNVFLIGEISNFKNHYQSGHLYFSLKDESCVVKAVMFSFFANNLKFIPKDGMRVILRGRVSSYEASGQYQVYVEDMQQDGFGALMFEFEQLKHKLEEEGLFSQERKKPLPEYPEKIGVITSKTGAAIKDIETVLLRRYPVAQIVFCPVQVQGAEAPNQIAEAIKKFNTLKACDVLIVGRGGGSAEDLKAFNNENVAYAVSGSSIPIISAVGHETDFTICDFCADLRAPTPSAAAELAVPIITDLLENILQIKGRLKNSINFKMDECKDSIRDYYGLLEFYSPLNLIKNERFNINFLHEKLKNSFSKYVFLSKERFLEFLTKLDALSPLNVLSRGYAIAVLADDKKVIKNINSIKENDKITVKLCDGEIDCTVNKRRKVNYAKISNI